jgi:ABC-type sugar transport system substrate-binding protein
MMRRTVVTALATAAVAGSMLVGPVAANAQTYYSSCTALHRDFRHGVAKSYKAALREHHLTGYPMAAYGRHARNVYWANYTRLDRDKDGVDCEA